ncbi:NACHT, LRR and PYD domains-containing protein 12-like [Engraulis encrasicolus]|uniref:NACHT, LRR and PYD domains-containing protein 12-like n=1 Tax=Engraulis encrasicolus TaxID=184585 RepID=UPI002FD261BD
MEMQQAHKSLLLERSKCLMEGLAHQGSSTLLRKIYTDLYITEGGGWSVNEEHEVRQIERASWREAAQGRPIKCSDIMNRLSEEVSELSKQVNQMTEQVKPIGIVLTKGVAGIGKTVSVQKFILDWAEGTSNQDVDFIFPLPFRELNLMKEKTISLLDLLRHFFSYVKDPRVFTSLENRVMFIFDGLDECRLPLDFCSNPECCDVTKSIPVDVLLTNLIQGNMLPFALLWITTRPAAANQIPPRCVNQVTEIRGYNDPQKEEYFRKKLSDESLASRIITHLKSCRSLFIMCHIPVFSWILATVVERTSDGSGSVEMPRTLTQMYTHFLIIQDRIKNNKYTESDKRDEKMIFKLGKLAFQQLEMGNLIFYEEDLRQCGIDVTEASVYSGVCTQIFREEAGLYQGKVFSFVHLSIQEFLAALYVFLFFISRERKMPDQTSQLSALLRAATLHDLLKTAVDLALQSKNGHLDLFLRFLLGLSLESNQSLLRELLPQTSRQPQNSEQTVQLVKQKIRGHREKDRSVNLFYCLNELNQHAVVEHIDRSSRTLTIEMLLAGQWKTEKFKFMTSEEYLDGFDLQKYILTPELDQTDLLIPEDVLQKMIPSDVFTSSTSAELESCPLSVQSCSYMASALTSHSSRLTQLTLRGPDPSSSSSLTVSSSAGCHPDCKPRKLRLVRYTLTEEICSSLVSALTSNTSTLSGERLKEEEVERLCSTLSHQDCRLEKLQLEWCPLSGQSWSYMASALTSQSSRLTQLTLENTEAYPSSLTVSSSAGCHPDCKPRKLRLKWCPLSGQSCSYMASALTSNSYSLTKLKLKGRSSSSSSLTVSSSAGCHPDCKPWKLRLKWCPLSGQSCSYMASALTSHSSSLIQLTLEGTNRSTYRSLTVSSSAGCHPDCKPNKLSLRGCDLTEEICNLVSALTSHTSTLSGKHLEKKEAERLCSTLSHQDCRLETLELEWCPLSGQSWSYISSALTSHSSRLTQLTLQGRSSSSSSLHVSSSAGCHPDCKPRKLSLQGYTLTEEICNLVSALTSHTSTLTGEDLNTEEDVERLCSTLSHQDCRLETLE